MFDRMRRARGGNSGEWELRLSSFVQDKSLTSFYDPPLGVGSPLILVTSPHGVHNCRFGAS